MRQPVLKEPLRGFVHGILGSGKSRVIKWICRIFTEAMQWEHGVEFVCVAFQNRVAYAMGGTTLHIGGNVSVGGRAEAQSLTHTDVDLLFTRNQHLRWLIVDECFMIGDELLGSFESNLRDAAMTTRYKQRADGIVRPLGGYNALLLGDMLQLPPIPASSATLLPPRLARMTYSTLSGAAATMQ